MPVRVQSIDWLAWIQKSKVFSSTSSGGQGMIAAFDPNSQAQLLIWVCFSRANDYVPNLEETEMLRQCTSRLRLYATAGLIGGGSVVAAVLRVSQQRIQFDRMQKITWIACSSVVGAFIGVQTAGPACLKQLVALPSSPMATEARRLYVPLLWNYTNHYCTTFRQYSPIRRNDPPAIHV
jgi:hypothetical protein